MKNSNLKKLLVEYNLKRDKAISEASLKKEKLYSSNPRLQEIDLEISSFALSTAKTILQTNNKKLLNDLESKKQNLLKEKKEIYSSLKVSEEYFYPHFECKLCKDTGYITHNYSTTMCSCLKQRLFDLEYNTINTFDIRNNTFDKFSTDIYSSIPNKDKYGSPLSPKKNIEIIKKLSTNFINNFDNPNEKSLLFTGNTGLGKTFISTCIANELLKKGKTVLYQTAPIMLDSIISSKLGKSTDFNIIKNLYSVDLLIIDDLGTENLNNMSFSELFTLLNARLLNQNNRSTKTIISTNLSLDNIASTYGERIISRFIGGYNICYFFGDDLRLQK